ncbi:Prophage integrase IntS [Patescibacteria group bacterium]|nr:Prophage integrase IntS [Patescibacteria group bacterium]
MKNALTDTAIRNAKPKDKDYRLSDGQGLYILIKTNGAKWWRFDYSFDGKRLTLSLGVYPQVSLSGGRTRANKARVDVANGLNPSDTRKAKKQAIQRNAENERRISQGLPVVGSFQFVAHEWIEKKVLSTSSSNQKNVKGVLNRLCPAIGYQQLTDIKARDLLAVLRLIEENSPITARKALQIAGQVFRYGIGAGYCEYDITSGLRGVLIPVKGGHFAAITDTQRLGQLLRAIDVYSGFFVTKSALQLAPLVFVRPCELCSAEWQHIDFESKQWCYTVTKTNTPHIVPLSNQAIAILTTLKDLTGAGRYVFPSHTNKNKPISESALLIALKRMGFDDTTTHGFRATARTLLEENLKKPYSIIEQQLAHTVSDTNGRAYNRTQHLEDRTNMMQEWSDYLDTLRQGAVIIPFKQIS